MLRYNGSILLNPALKQNVHINNLFPFQPKNDLEPLMDILNEYRGTLGQFPDVLKVHEVSKYIAWF
jgi:hypothetical protein